MPANLTPQYKEAEQRFREATGHEEKLAALREMMAIIPKHKGTEKLQADLRRRLAKLEEEGAHGHRGAAHRHDPGRVEREGAGQWVLIGPPNAGKSALVGALTHARPEVAPYPFTTHAPQLGMMPFEDVQVQLVDTPAVTAEHCESYMPNLVRAADGVVLVLNVAADDHAAVAGALRVLLERAHIALEPRAGEDAALWSNRPALLVLTHADLDPDGTFAALARDAIGLELPVSRVSTVTGEGLEALRRELFLRLDRIRIYAKEPGKKPDLERPFILERGATVHDLALRVHKEIAERMRFARIWGSAKFDGQQVERDHVLRDRDIVELHA